MHPTYRKAQTLPPQGKVSRSLITLALSIHLDRMWVRLNFSELTSTAQGTASMEFYQLKTFITVAEEGSLSRAATKVFVSLPAVSAQIKALEDEFGVQLFNRTAKGVHLTTAGSRLLVEAYAILAAASKMTTAVQLLRDELLGCARIGVLTDTLPLRLGELILDLSCHYPKLEVR